MANNFVMFKDKDTKTIFAILHETIIAKVKSNGLVTLDSGGWFTPTTVRHMNMVAEKLDLEFHVRVSKGKLYVTTARGEKEAPDGHTFHCHPVVDAVYNTVREV